MGCQTCSCWGWNGRGVDEVELPGGALQVLDFSFASLCLDPSLDMVFAAGEHGEDQAGEFVSCGLDRSRRVHPGKASTMSCVNAAFSSPRSHGREHAGLFGRVYGIRLLLRSLRSPLIRVPGGQSEPGAEVLDCRERRPSAPISEAMSSAAFGPTAGIAVRSTPTMPAMEVGNRLLFPALRYVGALPWRQVAPQRHPARGGLHPSFPHGGKVLQDPLASINRSKNPLTCGAHDVALHGNQPQFPFRQFRLFPRRAAGAILRRPFALAHQGTR